MISSKIYYVVALFISFFLMVMFEGMHLEIIFAVVLLLPFFMMLLLFIQKRALLITREDIKIIKKSDYTRVNISYNVKNRIIIPFLKIEVSAYIDNPYDIKREEKLVFDLGALKREKLVISFETCYSDRFIVNFEKARIFDTFSFFSLKKKINLFDTIDIKKGTKPYNLYIENIDEGEKGNEKPEIHEIKEYHQGDNIKDIHWKLTARRNIIFVKKYKSNDSVVAGIYINNTYRSGESFSLSKRQVFLENIEGIVSSFKMQGKEVALYVFDPVYMNYVGIKEEDIFLVKFFETSEDAAEYEFERKSNIGINTLITFSEEDGRRGNIYNAEDLRSEKPLRISGRNYFLLNEEERIFSEENYIKNMELQIIEENRQEEKLSYLLKLMVIFFGTLIPIAVFGREVCRDYSLGQTIIAIILGMILMLIIHFEKNILLKLITLIAGITSFVYYIGPGHIKSAFLTLLNGENESSMEFISILTFITAIMLFVFTFSGVAVVIHLLISVPLMAVPFSYQIVPEGGFIFIYTAYLITIIVMGGSIKNKKVVKEIHPGNQMHSVFLLWAYIIIIAVLYLFNMNLSGGYTRSPKLDEIKSEINKLFNIAEDTAYGGLSGGKLGRVSEVTYTGDKHLFVKVEGLIKGKVYLRGFVGNQYDGRNFYESGFSEDPSEMEYYLAKLEYENERVISREEPVHANIGIKKFVNIEKEIFPYYSNDNAKNNVIEYEYDVYSLKKPEEFIGLIYNGDEKVGIDYDKDDIDQLLKKEKELRENAHENGIINYSILDRDIYNEFETEIRRTIFTYEGKEYDLSKGVKANGYLPYIEFIKTYLRENCSYSLSPGKTDEDRDFVMDFIYNKKKGYCVHFASAATLMFKMFDIPARYVEGYAFDNPGSKGKNITDKSAHAWTEIYVDGFGYMIVDVTPGDENQGNSSNPETNEPTETQQETKADNNETETKIEETTALPSQETAIIPPEEESVPISEANKNDILKLNKESNNKFIIILLLPLLIAGVVYFRIKYIKMRFISKFNSADDNGKVLLYENEMNKVIRMKNSKIYTKNLNNTEIAKIVNENFSILNEDDINKLYYIFDKMHFSKNGVDIEEVDFCVRAVKRLFYEVYYEKRISFRVYMKYIKGLYLKRE